MGCLAGLALLALAAITSSGQAAARESLAGPVPAELIRILDADTLRVRATIWLDQDVEVNVRLAGLDTPEKGGRAKCARERRMAEEARALVEELLGTGPLILTDIQYGKYAGRVVAHVANAEYEDVSAALLEAGLARPYRGGTRQSWCG